MSIKYFLSRKFVWPALCLSTVLLIQPASAQKVALGGQYSLFDNLYIVATVPGDNAANCDNLDAAIAAVSAPSTIKLPPATYDCGSTVLNVPSGVTLEGSGQLDTRIIGQIDLFAILNTAAELNNLTLENTATNTNRVRVIDLRPGSVLNNVNLISSGAGNTENGAIAISTAGTEEIKLRDVTIRVSDGLVTSDGIAVFASNTSLQLNNVDIRATGAPTSCGVFIGSTSSPTIKIRNSVVFGLDDAISGGTPTLDIAHSRLNGRVITGGSKTCVSVYPVFDEFVRFCGAYGVDCAGGSCTIP
jgi:hypothetical protein